MKAIDKGLVRAPSECAVSRWRLAAPAAAPRCLLADSSPQRGFDWLMAETHTLAPREMASWTSTAWKLATTRQKLQRLMQALEATGLSQDHDEQDIEAQIVELQREREALTLILQAPGECCRDAVDIHLAPPTALGSRRSSLPRKVHCLLHTLRLEVGTWPAVANFLASVRAVTTDFGTEAGLASLENVDLSSLFPWASDALDFEVPQCSEQVPAGLHAQANPGPFLEYREGHLVMPKLFPFALQVPGALRVLHQSVHELTSAFQQYETWFLPSLRSITHVLGSKPIRERFVADAVRGSEAAAFEQALLQLQLNLHEARWGTLVTTCRELMSMRLVFTYWNSGRVIGQPPPAQAQEEEKRMHASAQTMTDAVHSAFFWQYMAMILRLARVVEHLEAWFEGCACHHRQPDASVPLESNVVWRSRLSCPLAGRRAPELAAGALDKMIADAFGKQRAELIVACSSLSPEHRGAVTQDFASGQAKLEHFLVVKFGFWTTLPHCLCVLGHWSEAEAKSGLAKAKELYEQHQDSNKHHALTTRFFAGPLTAQVQSFLAGESSRAALADLMTEASACLFVSCVERSIEARHALLKAKTAVVKRITPATFSIAIRSHEFHRRCLADESMLAEWEKHVKRLKVRPRTGLPHVLLRLGMRRHPEVLRLQTASRSGSFKLRDAANIIYHCDLLTQYELRSDAAKTMTQPSYRDNPHAVAKQRKLVARQASPQEKQSTVLRILMLEHFRFHCHEGDVVSLSGTLPEARFLRSSLLPQPKPKPEPVHQPPLQMPAASQPSFLTPDPDPAELASFVAPAAPAPGNHEEEALVHRPDIFVEARFACDSFLISCFEVLSVLSC